MFRALTSKKTEAYFNYINKGRNIMNYRLTSSNNINRNKKRIILTILLVAGVIGASFLVYLIPG
jgi:hypothetical protein